jgi:hypothetical protein
MLQLGKRGRFVAKALLNLRVARVLRMQDLDGDLPRDGQMLREPNFTHSAFAELADQAVVLDDGIGSEHVTVWVWVLGLTEGKISKSGNVLRLSRWTKLLSVARLDPLHHLILLRNSTRFEILLS